MYIQERSGNEIQRNGDECECSQHNGFLYYSICVPYLSLSVTACFSVLLFGNYATIPVLVNFKNIFTI
jgi:hypothetical protein